MPNLFSSLKLANFKLIAFDMDGTALDGNNRLNLPTVDAIRKAHDVGFKTVFATGRMPSAVIDHLRVAGTSGWVISHNGALVSNLLSGETAFKYTLNPEFIAILIKMHKELHVPLHLNLSDSVVTDKKSELSRYYEHDLNIHISESNLNAKSNVITALFLGSNRELKIIQDLVASCTEGYSTVLIHWFDSQYMLQFLPKEISKGKSLFKWAESQMISPDEIISFGDNYNDLDMLTGSGLGIAMKNAPDLIQESADMVTDSNTNNGVANALTKIIKLREE